MPKMDLRAAPAAMASLCLLSACGSQWSTQDAKFYKYQNKDVRVAAKIVMHEKSKPVEGSGGVDFELRLYTKDYAAVLTERSEKVGATLEQAGTVNVPEIITIAISEWRLGGTPNTYENFCAEIRMDRSNVDDWRKIGCVNYVDTPSESPTGGLQ